MTAKSSSLQKTDISIVVTCHAESILLHRTLASIVRATKQLDDHAISYEMIVHLDNPSKGTSDYVNTHLDSSLKNARIFTNTFGDLGSSRNFAVKEATGTYIATIDADDLMSANWLYEAFTFVEAQIEPTVAHTEVTIEFEGADGYIIKHGEIDHDTDALLSVHANRWNSIVLASRKLLLEEPYMPNSPGYGYEDWQLNCHLIARNVHNVLIPNTVIFVRRKHVNSEWLRQIQSMAVLRANPLLSFSSIRAIPTNPFKEYLPSTSVGKSYRSLSLKDATKRAVVRYPLVYKVVRRLAREVRDTRTKVKKPLIVPKWLRDEWQAMHTIERQIFPSVKLLSHMPIYDSLTLEHKIAGAAYKQIVDSLAHDNYDYLLFVPWLIKGGADEFTYNYANEIARANPKKRVLVVATMPTRSVWQKNLDPSIGFLEFGCITEGVPRAIAYRLMSHIIENAKISHIHIINSEFGYDFVRIHETYIKASNKKVVATSFSQSIDKDGRLYGYSHTHVPFIYDTASLITSDNKAVLTMWEKEYGFDPAKLIVHRQRVDLAGYPLKKFRRPKKDEPLRVLWAGRVAPEKQPELLKTISKQIAGKATLTIYGAIENGHQKYVHDLPSSATYMGSFDGPENLPFDDFDVLLYTSLFDGMPNTLLHSARAGLPIIASNVGGISEFITDQTGVLIEDIKNPHSYSEAIINLANHPESLDEYRKQAYQKLQSEFSPEKYTAAITAFLETLDY